MRGTHLLVMGLKLHTPPAAAARVRQRTWQCCMEGGNGVPCAVELDQHIMSARHLLPDCLQALRRQLLHLPAPRDVLARPEWRRQMWGERTHM